MSQKSLACLKVDYRHFELQKRCNKNILKIPHSLPLASLKIDFHYFEAQKLDFEHKWPEGASFRLPVLLKTRF